MLADSERIISHSSLPSGPNVAFHESPFFSRNEGKSFPGLSEVRTESAHQHLADHYDMTDPPPVLFESLGLLVKYLLPEVPVPEIYGWTTEVDYVILYMELVKGINVEKLWPTMTDDERAGFWKGVRGVVDNLGKLSQEPNDHFIGPIYGHALETGKSFRIGPFASVKEFHDSLSVAIKVGAEVHWPGLKPEELCDGYRHLVPDDAALVFTHADLHPTNIMVDTDDPSKIAAVIDWGQSGG